MIDYLNISFPKEISFDLSDITETVFGKSLYKKNKAYSFLSLEGVDGLTVVPFFTHLHIQLSGEFWQRTNAFEEAQTICRTLKSVVKVTVVRVDVCRDFIGESVEQLIALKFAHSKYFPNGESSYKPVVYGNPPETIAFIGRHKKIRLYDKIKQIQFLLSKDLAKPHHIEFLRQYGQKGASRFEIELRSNFARYADSIFLDCANAFEFENQVLNNFLIENPMISDRKQLHPLWKRLLDPNFEKKRSEKQKKELNKEARNLELQKAQSLIANKFEKWGFNELDAFKFLLEAFNLLQKGDYFPAIELAENNEVNELRSYNELRAEIALYRIKYGPLKAACPKGKAA